jgi:predicted porin
MIKKILISSILANVVVASAFANAPTVKVGGLLDFQAASRSQTKAYGNNVGLISQNNKNISFDNTAHLYVKAEGKADNGLVYGAVVRITPTASLDKLEQADKKNKKLERTYLFLESDLGRFELGSNYSAGETMKVGAETIAAATGGVAGDYVKYINRNMTTMATDGVTPLVADFAGLGQNKIEAFIEEPNLFSDYEVALTSGSEKSRKITYFTPRTAGFQFGISYAPDSQNRGYNSDAQNTGTLLGSILGANRARKNELNGGIHFTRQLHNHTIITAAVTADYASGKLNVINGGTAPSRKQLFSYNAGLQLDFAGFSVAGSYGNWGKSLNSKTDTNYQTQGSGRYWTAGAAYSQGPAKVSVTYMDSKLDANKKRSVSVGADYLLARGFLPYAEVTNVRYKPYNVSGTENTPKNTATVYMLGAELVF